MAENLYGRIVRVTISTPVTTPGNFRDVTREELVINGGEGTGNKPGLRVVFDVKLTDEKDPNTCELTVTNLSPTSRGKLQKKGVKVTVEAGYQQTGLSRIFRGDARTIDHIRNGADWDTVIKCGDGERAYQNARVEESFAPGTKASTVLQFLGERSGLQIGNVPDIVLDVQGTVFDQGYTLSGKWSSEMARFCKAIGYTFSVQDETLQVLLPGANNKALIPLISPDSGLVGSPEFGTPEKKGKPALVKFTSLLRPTRPRSKVHLRSQRYDGEVVTKKCQLKGDTHGGEWYTHYEGVLLGEVRNR